MQELQATNQISSLELVKQINTFRNEIEGKALLEHKDLLKVIRDEFSEEIGEGKISPTTYTSTQNKELPMFTLTLSQAKQVLVRESKAVRKATIKYIEELEAKQKAPNTLEDILIYQLQELKQVKSEINDLKQMQSKVVELNQKLQSLQIPQAQPLSNKLCSSSDIGKPFGLGGRMVNIILRDAGVLFYRKNRPMLYARYRNKGFTKRRDNHDYWTEKGKVFVEQVLREQV